MSSRAGQGRDRAAPTADPGRRRALFILVTALLFPLLVVIAYFATRSVLPELSNLNFSLPQGNATSSAARSINITSLQLQRSQLFPSFKFPSLPNLPEINLLDLFLILGMVIAAVLLLRGMDARKVTTAPFEDDELLLDERRRKVAEILDAAAAKLASGSSYRETVLQCYKMVSEVLEERSEVEGRALTAREFRRLVSQKLRIDSPYLKKVTDLFELARYSKEEISREQAEEAATCLSNLSEPLKQTIASVSDIK